MTDKHVRNEDISLRDFLKRMVDFYKTGLDGRVERLSVSVAAKHLNSIKRVLNFPLFDSCFVGVTAADINKDKINDIAKRVAKNDSQLVNIKKALTKSAQVFLQPVKSDVNFDKAIENTLFYLSGNDCVLAKSTIQSYIQSLRSVQGSEYAVNLFSMMLSEVDVHRIRPVLADVARGASSHRQLVSALRCVARVNLSNFPAANDLPLTILDEEKVNVVYLTDREMDKILTCDVSLISSNETIALRARCAAALVMGGLLKTKDLQSFKIGSLTSSGLLEVDGVFVFKTFSEMPIKNINIVNDYVSMLSDLYPQVRIHASTPLFFSPKNATSSLSRMSLWADIDKAVESGGYRQSAHDSRTGGSIHHLRVSSARRLYAMGADEQKLCQMAQVANLGYLDDFLHIDDALRLKREEVKELQELYMK